MKYNILKFNRVKLNGSVERLDFTVFCSIFKLFNHRFLVWFVNVGYITKFLVGFGTPNLTELPVNKEIAILTDVKTNWLIHRFSSWKNASECKKNNKATTKAPKHCWKYSKMGYEDWTWKQQQKLTLPGDKRNYSRMGAKAVPYICILLRPCESNVYSVSDILVSDKISNSFLPTIVEP